MPAVPRLFFRSFSGFRDRAMRACRIWTEGMKPAINLIDSDHSVSDSRIVRREMKIPMVHEVDYGHIHQRAIKIEYFRLCLHWCAKQQCKLDGILPNKVKSGDSMRCNRNDAVRAEEPAKPTTTSSCATHLAAP
jgi:hypothetical protein